MCSGFLFYEELVDRGIKVPAIRCFMCGRYTFKEDALEIPIQKCKHGRVYCGICELMVTRRLKREEFLLNSKEVL